MLNRRTFITSSMAALGSTTLPNNAKAEQQSADTKVIGAYSYRLPAFKKGSRLLFQGDSITDMKWGRDQSDRNHYLGHSYVSLIAARLGVDMPEAKLDIYNRGISGNTAANLRKRWEKDAIDMNPDILSILVIYGCASMFFVWLGRMQGTPHQPQTLSSIFPQFLIQGSVARGIAN